MINWRMDGNWMENYKMLFACIEDCSVQHFSAMSHKVLSKSAYGACFNREYTCAVPLSRFNN